MLNKELLSYLPNCTVLSTVSQQEDEEAWLKARTHGIGGSDVGAICGVSPFSSARQIYLKKTGQFDESTQMSKAQQERMHFGHLLEPIVANEFSSRTGKKLIEVGATLAHKDYPWALANVDRLIVDDDGKPYGILECKTTSEYNNEEWENGEILLSYIYQLNWYMFILDISYGAFACLVGGNKFYYYEVFRNDELLKDTIFPAAEHFWNVNVKQLIEPELQVADEDFVNLTYSEAEKNSEITIEDDNINELAAVVVECKKRMKELETTMKEAQVRIKDCMQEHEIGYCRDYTIKWSPRTRTAVDTNLLKKNFPEVYEQCLRTTSYRAFTVKGLDN